MVKTLKHSKVKSNKFVTNNNSKRWLEASYSQSYQPADSDINSLETQPLYSLKPESARQTSEPDTTSYSNDMEAYLKPGIGDYPSDMPEETLNSLYPSHQHRVESSSNPLLEGFNGDHSLGPVHTNSATTFDDSLLVPEVSAKNNEEKLGLDHHIQKFIGNENNGPSSATIVSDSINQDVVSPAKVIDSALTKIEDEAAKLMNETDNMQHEGSGSGQEEAGSLTTLPAEKSETKSHKVKNTKQAISANNELKKATENSPEETSTTSLIGVNNDADGSGADEPDITSSMTHTIKGSVKSKARFNQKVNGEPSNPKSKEGSKKVQDKNVKGSRRQDYLSYTNDLQNLDPSFPEDRLADDIASQVPKMAQEMKATLVSSLKEALLDNVKDLTGKEGYPVDQGEATEIASAAAAAETGQQTPVVAYHNQPVGLPANYHHERLGAQEGGKVLGYQNAEAEPSESGPQSSVALQTGYDGRESAASGGGHQIEGDQRELSDEPVQIDQGEIEQWQDARNKYGKEGDKFHQKQDKESDKMNSGDKSQEKNKKESKEKSEKIKSDNKKKEKAKNKAFSDKKKEDKVDDKKGGSNKEGVKSNESPEETESHDAEESAAENGNPDLLEDNLMKIDKKKLVHLLAKFMRERKKSKEAEKNTNAPHYTGMNPLLLQTSHPTTSGHGQFIYMSELPSKEVPVELGPTNEEVPETEEKQKQAKEHHALSPAKSHAPKHDPYGDIGARDPTDQDKATQNRHLLAAKKEKEKEHKTKEVDGGTKDSKSGEKKKESKSKQKSVEKSKDASVSMIKELSDNLDKELVDKIMGKEDVRMSKLVENVNKNNPLKEHKEHHNSPAEIEEVGAASGDSDGRALEPTKDISDDNIKKLIHRIRAKLLEKVKKKHTAARKSNDVYAEIGSFVSSKRDEEVVKKSFRNRSRLQKQRK